MIRSVCVSCDMIGTMPPLEVLLAPVRLKMRCWGAKRSEWQEAVTRSLSIMMTVPEENRFAELERLKCVALDCARTVLGTD